MRGNHGVSQRDFMTNWLTLYKIIHHHAVVKHMIIHVSLGGEEIIMINYYFL